MAFDSYIICTSPRSGSTLLCRLLRPTGIAGYPESHFHTPSLEAWLSCYDLQHDDTNSEQELLGSIFQAAIACGNRNTGIFGLRLQRHSFDFFTEKLALLHPEPASDAQRISAAFGCTFFIHLTRDDKLEQAISYVKAQQTGLWHMSSDGTELERLGPAQELSYEANAIRRLIEEFSAFESDWNDWFERERITPLRLSYEALSQSPQDTVGTVLDHLDLDPEVANTVRPDVSRLADDVSREWARRYRREER